MSLKDSAGLQTSGTMGESTDEPTINGPTPAFDIDDTGSDDGRCPGCGVEAMRHRERRDGDGTCTGGWA